MGIGDVTDDSKYFLTGSADGEAKVFNVRYGEQILSLRQQGPVPDAWDGGE